MLCVVIRGPSFEEAHNQVAQAAACASLIELRLDCFERVDMAALRRLRTACPLPMIFSHPSIEQLSACLDMGPEYIDLAYQLSTPTPPGTKRIASYHDYTGMPEDLDRLYCEMQAACPHAALYKVAVTAASPLDAVRLLRWAASSDGRLIAVSMGPHGQLSRILGPIVGTSITYASLDDNAPFGQLPAHLLIERYHHHRLSRTSGVYGLIGDPVDRSIGPIVHNAFIISCGLDAVYVPIRVQAKEVGAFLRLARTLPFRGLSVTMPLKEAVLDHIDEIDSEARAIGAVNTLVFRDGRIFGYNTDGRGTLDAIERVMSVRDKRVVIVGAGGAAKAIAYEVKKRGGTLAIINRDAEKACELARRLSCCGGGLEEMANAHASGYDILINCTPLAMPVAPEHIPPGAIVMDINMASEESVWLRCAVERGCRVIPGREMFEEQARGQRKLWFGR